MYRAALRRSTWRKIWSSPLLPEKDIPHFTAMTSSCHSFLAVRMSVHNCFQRWSTGRVKFHPKSLLKTSRAYWELQSLPSNQTDAFISWKQAQISHALHVFFTFFNILIKKKLKNKFCYFYTLSINFSWLTVAQASQIVGHPCCTLSSHIIHC